MVMILLRAVFFCLLVLLQVGQIFSQNKYPKNYFVSPVKHSLTVLSNFGDIRSNHFHTGLDIRTGDGNKLYAAADGYVSRIKVSPVGYGKAIYITHPNGYTTVYAHLKSYSDKIDGFVKRKQYLAQDYAVEFFPDSGEIEICKNEIIGLSGNTGMSLGAHLHFEIRDTKSEHIINPLLFYDLKDKAAPVIAKLHIYPIDNKSSVNGLHSRLSFDVKAVGKKGGKVQLKKAEKLTLVGRIGFGIEAYDRDDDSKDRSNIYGIDIKIDTISLYSCRFEEFSFDDKRNVNSYIDFKEYATHYKNIQRCFVAPNNKTPIYSNLQNQGIYDFNDGGIHNISISVLDVNNNSTCLEFKALGSISEKEYKEEKNEYSKVMPYEDVNYFVRDDIMISFPEDIFYDTVYFDYQRIEAKKLYYSAIHAIRNKFTPINKKMIVSIKTDSIPKKLLSKTIIASISKSGALTSIGGQIADNFLTAETFDFGNFAIVADTIPPEIISLNIVPWEDLTLGKTIRFKITDVLSGVKKFSGFIDGRWMLFEYDKKTDLAIFSFNDFPITGDEHNVEMIVEDEKGNKTSFCCPFYR